MLNFVNSVKDRIDLAMIGRYTHKDGKPLTHKQIVKVWLEAGQEITEKKAVDLFGIYNVRNRIGELKRDGLAIKDKMVTGRNRRGQPTRYKRWWLVDTN